jgi:hypothetical protein
MAGKTALPLLLLLVALLLPACINLKQSSQEINYFTLEYPPPEFPGLSPLPVTLQVEHFTSSPDYDSDQIIYRNESYARNAYAYYRWRAKPDRLVRDFLARDFQRSGLFKAIFTEEGGRLSEYALEGSVEELAGGSHPRSHPPGSAGKEHQPTDRFSENLFGTRTRRQQRPPSGGRRDEPSHGQSLCRNYPRRLRGHRFRPVRSESIWRNAALEAQTILLLSPTPILEPRESVFGLEPFTLNIEPAFIFSQNA